jgi:hypothetical protein
MNQKVKLIERQIHKKIKCNMNRGGIVLTFDAALFMCNMNTQ